MKRMMNEPKIDDFFDFIALIKADDPYAYKGSVAFSLYTNLILR
jgi:hypothetical protein